MMYLFVFMCNQGNPCCQKIQQLYTNALYISAGQRCQEMQRASPRLRWHRCRCLEKWDFPWAPQPPTRWCPPVISWLMNPINYSYISHKPDFSKLCASTQLWGSTLKQIQVATFPWDIMGNTVIILQIIIGRPIYQTNPYDDGDIVLVKQRHKPSIWN